MPNNYGQPIGRSDASDLFARYFNIKERNHAGFLEVLDKDEEGRRYFCGADSTYRVQMDILYLFDRDSVQRIMDKINNGDADGMMVFPAAHNDGRPTVMLFPVKYDTSGSDTLYTVLDEGEQHPGGGGTGIDAIFSGTPELPSRFTDSHIY